MNHQATTETKGARSPNPDGSAPARRFTWAVVVWAVVATGVVVLVLPRGRDPVSGQSQIARNSVVPAEPSMTVSSLVNLGNLAMQERASDEAALDRALDHFTRGHELDSEHLNARFALAWARQVKGLPQSQWQALYRETVAEASILTYLSLYNLAYAEQQAGRHTDAIAMLDHALRVMPERADGWLALGTSQLTIGEHERAVMSFARATELDSESGWAFHQLGRAHALLGQEVEAEAAWAHALELSPELKSQVDSARAVGTGSVR
jgi:tetratricopeptide (TPR) repeat protein